MNEERADADGNTARKPRDCIRVHRAFGRYFLAPPALLRKGETDSRMFKRDRLVVVAKDVKRGDIEWIAVAMVSHRGAS